jgi:hypothetical protein
MAAALITRAMLNARHIPAGAAKARIFDTKTTGFIAELRPTGVTLYFRFSDERKRRHELKLGRYGDVTLEQARRRAEKLRAQVSLGGDPIADRTKRLAIPLFSSFVQERYLPWAKETLRSYPNVEAYCRKRIVPFFGRKSLDEVTVTDVADFRRSLLDGSGLSHASVNRHLATLRAMFNLAKKWELWGGANPASSPGMLREQHREHYLSAEQCGRSHRIADAHRRPQVRGVVGDVAGRRLRARGARGAALQAWRHPTYPTVAACCHGAANPAAAATG